MGKYGCDLRVGDMYDGQLVLAIGEAYAHPSVGETARAVTLATPRGPEGVTVFDDTWCPTEHYRRAP
jgi:hypothetical protein